MTKVELNMISVLIPVYNFNILRLVKDVKEQLDKQDLIYEIICMDDGSDQSIIDKNKVINEFQNARYITTLHNSGSVLVRQRLGELAQFPWLLYLDADVEIFNNDFIKKYVATSKQGHDVVFGGFSYKSIPPSRDYVLRWKYGQAKEEVPARQRNKNPYKVVISANYLIKKSIFLKIYGKIDYKGYGYDNYFGALLKQYNIKVYHIDNEVYHNGIEANDIYLRKTESAIQALNQIYRTGKLNIHSNTLLRTFIWIKKLGLKAILGFIYDELEHTMKSNLLGNNPSINIFQLYKIIYLCKMSN